MNLKLREEDSCCVVTCIYKYIFFLSKRKVSSSQSVLSVPFFLSLDEIKRINKGFLKEKC